MRERVNLERSDSRHVVVGDFIRAAVALGFEERDFCAEVAEGVGWFALNKVGGLRHSSSVAYLHPLDALPDRARLPVGVVLPACLVLVTIAGAGSKMISKTVSRAGDSTAATSLPSHSRNPFAASFGR
jgi:hypothetical protein